MTGQAREVRAAAERVRGMSRPRFQYGLRSLLLVSAVIAAVSGVVGTQVRGRLQTEVDPPFVTDLSWSPVDRPSLGTLWFECVTEGDARRLAAQFDPQQFCSHVGAILGRQVPAANGVLKNFLVNAGQDGKLLFIKYDFAQWGRYRLDLRQMAYVLDRSDSDAHSRNDAIHRAFYQAGEALAKSNPAITRVASSFRGLSRLP
jgi:hypothetical protein